MGHSTGLLLSRPYSTSKAKVIGKDKNRDEKKVPNVAELRTNLPTGNAATTGGRVGGRRVDERPAMRLDRIRGNERGRCFRPPVRCVQITAKTGTGELFEAK